MGMPASGNPIPASSMNRGLLRTATQAIDWNDTELRAVAVKPSGQISSSDLYDKSTGSIRVTSAYNSAGLVYGWSGVYYGAGGVDAYWGFTGSTYFDVWECYWIPAPYNCIIISYGSHTMAQVTSRPGGAIIKDANFNVLYTYRGATYSNVNGKCRCTIPNITTNPFPVGSVRWLYPG